MTSQMIFVLVVVVAIIYALIKNDMRQGLVLFSAAALLFVGGVINPEELLMGFSNRGVFTVALLFLVSEGVKRTGAINNLIKPLFPETPKGIRHLQLRLLPSVALISSMLNNTPVVIIVAPIVKNWASKMKVPASKFLIPLSYATILGGMCSLIGSSTNLVVHGMMLNAGYAGFSMYELGKVGIFIAIAGLIYIFLFSKYLLPENSNISSDEELEGANYIQVVISERFPGINRKVSEFDFKRRFGATMCGIKRNGEILQGSLDDVVYQKSDTLIIDGDDTFFKTWGSSSFFVLLIDGKEHDSPTKKKKWLAVSLLIFMCVGALLGEHPAVRAAFPEVRLDMFFFALVVTIIMAWAQLFPAKRYTKYISWDLLITIASAFAISQAMQNSGIIDLIVSKIIALTGEGGVGPYALLAIVFIFTNLFTELITNNAAAALAFPLAISITTQLGINPMPFFVAICIAASSSFSTPIGYQTNLIVQSIGNYKYLDFVRIGLPLNLITFVLSIILIPLIWRF
ncbi:MAG: SLC13 family permease [Rikenellaceae bacterium]